MRWARPKTPGLDRPKLCRVDDVAAGPQSPEDLCRDDLRQGADCANLSAVAVSFQSRDVGGVQGVRLVGVWNCIRSTFSCRTPD
jgi:hypothetical protein